MNLDRVLPKTNKGKISDTLKWKNLLLPVRQRVSTNYQPSPFDLRNEFEKDYHRIVQSASFRRLQDKTQVFPLDQSDFVRTRLTHSLEVSSLAKSLGQLVFGQIQKRMNDKSKPSLNEDLQLSSHQGSEISDLLLCAGLVHDIGNPPFGHYGETTIRQWFKENLSKLRFKDSSVEEWLSEQQREDLFHFEGNAQALRVLTKLHFLIDEYGMNLTLPLLHLVMKYPVSSLEIEKNGKDIHTKKMGYFYAEKDLFKEIVQNMQTGFKRIPEVAEGLYLEETKQLAFLPNDEVYGVCRHPLTYLLEAADDIAYCTADIEDAYKKTKLSFVDLLDDLQKEYKRLKDFPSQQLAIKEQLQVLKDKKEHAIKQGYAKPEYYAIQNWLIQVQSLLLNEVAQNFLEQYELLMQGQLKVDLLSLSSKAKSLKHILSKISEERVFKSSQIIKMELSASSIIGGLMDLFVPACIYMDQPEMQSPLHLRLMDIVSDNYKQCYYREKQGKSEGEKLYLRLLLVTDYISGMTDHFAKNLYNELKGNI